MAAQAGDPAGPSEDPVVVVVGAGRFTVAFALEHVIEIVPLEDITPLFQLPEHLLGMTNVRGRVVPVSDLGRLLGSAPSGRERGGKGLLVRRGAQEVIFAISGVAGTRPLPPAGLEDPPVNLPEVLRPLARGLLAGDPPVLLLDTGRLLDQPGAWPYLSAGREVSP